MIRYRVSLPLLLTSYFVLYLVNMIMLKAAVQMHQKITKHDSRQYCYLNRGKVCINCPSSVGYCCCLEKTGASVVSPLGLQKPLVVQSVKGQGMPSSLTMAKIL